MLVRAKLADDDLEGGGGGSNDGASVYTNSGNDPDCAGGKSKALYSEGTTGDDGSIDDGGGDVDDNDSGNADKYDGDCDVDCSDDWGHGNAGSDVKNGKDDDDDDDDDDKGYDDVGDIDDNYYCFFYSQREWDFTKSYLQFF